MWVGAEICSVDHGRGVELARAPGSTGLGKELRGGVPANTLTASRWLLTSEALHGGGGNSACHDGDCGKRGVLRRAARHQTADGRPLTRNDLAN